MKTWVSLLLGICLSLLFAVPALGQEEAEGIFARLRDAETGSGRVQIYQPWRLYSAVNGYHARNTQEPGCDGYRVRIYRGIGKKARRESESVVERVLKLWPGLPVFRTYASPDFLVAVGNCRTRYEALSIRSFVLAEFPQAFVVSTRIDFPLLDTLSLRARIEQKRQQQYLDSVEASRDGANGGGDVQ